MMTVNVLIGDSFPFQWLSLLLLLLLLLCLILSPIIIIDSLILLLLIPLYVLYIQSWGEGIISVPTLPVSTYDDTWRVRRHTEGRGRGETEEWVNTRKYCCKEVRLYLLTVVLYWIYCHWIYNICRWLVVIVIELK